jgi:hypothetical protein
MRKLPIWDGEKFVTAEVQETEVAAEATSTPTAISDETGEVQAPPAKPAVAKKEK